MLTAETLWLSVNESRYSWQAAMQDDKGDWQASSARLLGELGSVAK